MMTEDLWDVRDEWIFTVLWRGTGNFVSALGRTMLAMKVRGLEVDFCKTPTKSSREADATYGCAQVHAFGHMSDEAGIREELLRLADETGADVVVQRKKEWQAERKLFVFDMDSTLIHGETIDELAKMAGVSDRVMAITASAMRGEIEFQESFRRRVALLAGLPEAKALEVVRRIPLMDGAERLFRALKKRGAKTAILSGGFTFLGSVLQQKLGADYLFANELDLADGFVTGDVRGGIVDGARKAELLVEIAGREGISLEQVVAVGDGANDLPMLGLAGMGVAFHAKPVVRASARYAVSHVGLDGLLELVRLGEERNA
ncbi:MAG TPA: phosphoserine phosphatase SerB [Acidobacteriaceae bacterium]|jgi:phosphoserine phosphatase|nr:phosphoserine phosphatase SerB [Acidobacteriaceae bacterium]